MAVKPNTPAALEFLRLFHPGRPWVVTTIATDKKALETKTFHEANAAELTKWLDQFNGVRNCYFSTNPVIRDVNKKAERTDISEVVYLHVDVDPRVGEDLVAERARILALFTTGRPSGVPEPTCVVFSGGGYQAFWLLDEPLPIEGNLEKAEDAKLYNKQLEIIFGGDNCHNIDRIMRLPGTVNVPDAKKVKKGRQPELAEMVLWTGKSYPISAFLKAQKVATKTTEGFYEADTVTIGSNIPKVADLSELDEWGVQDRVKVIIAQGSHPDEPKHKDNSRSAWVFDAVCNLLRAKVPDDVIYSILMDPDWAISESVLEFKGNAEKYAKRQIAKGKQYIIEPRLVELNEKYAVIESFGGQCLIVFEQRDEALGRKRLVKQTFDNFVRAKMNERVPVGQNNDGSPKWAPLGKWWIGHPERRQYERVVFAPGQEVAKAYNLWQGFSVEPRPGDKHLKYLEHIRINLCQGNEEHYQWLLNWMARAVQKPNEQGHVAVVIRGNRGAGKSLFATVFGELFGRHFMHVSNAQHLIGQFNSHLRDCSVLFADEAFYAGDKKHTSVLKTLITENTLAIEAKHVDVEIAPNYVHLIMASNDREVVKAAADERRFFMLEAGDTHKQDKPYFRAIVADLNSGGRENLLHFLLSRDISGYDPREVPNTEALETQKRLGISEREGWWLECLHEGRVVPGIDWDKPITRRLFREAYRKGMQEYATRLHGDTAQRMWDFIAVETTHPKLENPRPIRNTKVRAQEFGPDGVIYQGTGREAAILLPPLKQCREAWELNHSKENWTEDLDLEDEVPDRGRRDDDAPF